MFIITNKKINLVTLVLIIGQLKSQGKVQLSFELVPTLTASQERANGFGRS